MRGAQLLVCSSLLAWVVACGCTARPAGEERADAPPQAEGPGPVTVVPEEEDPMLASLAGAFRERNPGISSVTLLEYRRVAEGGGANFVLARGFRPRGQPFDDELFGVFMFDDSLARIVRTIDVFPTPRWLDYTIRIERADGESLVVTGAGLTHGDTPTRRSYAWRR